MKTVRQDYFENAKLERLDFLRLKEEGKTLKQISEIYDGIDVSTISRRIKRAKQEKYASQGDQPQG